MDKYIRVKNCNCISDATIEIVEKSLNIKYGSNGTGKSTISEAIYAQANNETDRLKDFKPYVLKTLGDPLSPIPNEVTDLNYPTLVLPKSQVTDHQYIYELAPFEWKTAERLKRDKGYMGKMSFPENLEKPARTVMATMSASSREAMILEHKEGKYRLPTVREAASMMSFPIDYWFYGKTKSIKHRYGLKEGTKTNYYYILSEDSIDETIDARLAEKEHRMNEIMESMPIPLFDNASDDLGDEDIKALIKDYVRRTKKN